MEIAGYNIPDKYALMGGLGVVVIGFALSRKKPSDTGEVATIKPAEGLSWSDIFPTGDKSGLIGPGGPIGDSGPPGLPGPITLPPTDTTPPPTDTTPPPTDTTPPPTDKTPKPGDGKTCSSNDDCGKNKKCRHGHCVDKTDGEKKRDNQGNTNPDRPKMPNNPIDTLPIEDPRLNGPKGDKKRNDGQNKTGDRRDNRDKNGGNRTDTPNTNNPNRNKDNANGGNVVHADPIQGHIHVNVHGGREVEKGKNANSSASGGTVNLGNIDKGAHGSINAGGGTAIARGTSSGTTGGRQCESNKDCPQGKHCKDGRCQASGAGYGSVAGLDSNGFGRVDGLTGTAEGFVRTNISPGTTAGGFSPVPATFGKQSVSIQEGETLKGLARRQYGLERMWPKIAVLNQDLDTPRGEIPAGTVFRT